eukprot:TRINITY_DN27125_c0_g2_i1.p1 TRINITY_DN27125_c0_g2~~TRINITY_DN27125_c0_g2_i1.p1  ORF type:complete len:520 (-),score=175.68 TRINITY_DN27125_c0_g2_i1:86-1603(-)
MAAGSVVPAPSFAVVAAAPRPVVSNVAFLARTPSEPRAAAGATAAVARPPRTADAVAAPPAVVAAPTPQEGTPQLALLEYSQRLSQRAAALQEELARVKEERDVLRAENEAIGEHVFGLQQENGMLHDIGFDSYVEKAQLAKLAEGSSTEASRLRDDSRQQREINQQLRAENGRLRGTLESVRSELAQEVHAKRGLEATLESVRSNLTQRISREGGLAERVAVLEKQLEEQGNEKARLDELVAGQHVEIARMQQVVADLNGERARSQSLHQRVESLESQLNHERREKEQLDMMVSNLHVEAASMKTQRDTAMAEVPILKTSLQAQSIASADLETQATQLRNVVYEFQRQNAALEKEVRLLRGTLDAARQEAGRQEQAILAATTDRVQLREALDALQLEKRDGDARLASTVSAKSLAQSHLEQLSVEKDQLQMHARQVASENAALRSRIAGLEMMAQGYQDEAAAAQQRYQLARGEKDDLEERLRKNAQPQRSTQQVLSSLPQGAL